MTRTTRLPWQRTVSVLLLWAVLLLTSGCGGGIALLTMVATSNDSDSSKDLPATVAAGVSVSALETLDRWLIEFRVRNDDEGTLAARVEYEVVDGNAPRRGRRPATPLPGSSPLEPVAPDETVRFLWDAKTDLEDQSGDVVLIITPIENGVEGEPYLSPRPFRAGNTLAEVREIAVQAQEGIVIIDFEVSDRESDIVEMTRLEVAVGEKRCDMEFHPVPEEVFGSLRKDYASWEPPDPPVLNRVTFSVAELDDDTMPAAIRRATQRGFFGEICARLSLLDAGEEMLPDCGCGPLDLNEPPEVELLPTRLTGGVVPLPFRIFDRDELEGEGSEVQTADVDVLVRIGEEFRPAYEFPAEVSSGQQALATLPASRRGELNAPVHVFPWDAAAQLGGVERGIVTVQLRAFDDEAVSHQTRAIAYDSDVELMKLTQDFAAGSNPSNCTSADYDRDGYLDAVVSNQVPLVTVLWGGSDGLRMGQPVDVPRSTGNLASGDFNGDGFPDAVFVQRNGIIIAELHGGPTGLSLHKYHIVDGVSNWVAVGNFDGHQDDYDDVVVTPDFWSADERVNFLRGSSDGLQFASSQRLPGAPCYPSAVDLNRDGTDEILVRVAPNSLHLLGFDQARRELTTLWTPKSPVRDPRRQAFADFNGDGVLDVAVVEHQSKGQITVFSGCDDGWFCSRYSRSVGRNPINAAAADFDRDGWIDLAVLNSGSVSYLVGGPGGTLEPRDVFAAPMGLDPGIACADVTGDGFPDLVVPNENEDTVTLLTGSAIGLQHGGTIQTGRRPQFVLAGDFDTDGLAEVVVVNHDSSTVSCLGADRSVFALGEDDILTEGTTTTVAAGDFDGDGERDLVVAKGAAGGLTVVYRASSVASRLLVDIESGARRVGALVAGDFDDEGRDDLVILGGHQNAVILLTRGLEGLPLQGIPIRTGGRFPQSATSADFNGDGLLDLVVANRASDDVSFLAGDDGPDGLRRVGEPIPVGTVPVDLASADFDLDGELDVVVVNSGSNDVSLLRGNAEGFHIPAHHVKGGNRQNPQDVVTGDFDGDGFPDAVVRSLKSLNLSFYRGSGQGLLWTNDIRLEEAPTVIVAGDFNGDAFSDVAVIMTLLDHVTLLRGGPQGFRRAQSFDCGEGPQVLLAGEFDGDSYLDLVVANSLERVTLLRGQPEGFRSFNERFDVYDLPTGFSPGILLSDDVTRDGFADIVVASQGAPGLHLLRHRGRTLRVNRLVDPDGDPPTLTEARYRLALPPHPFEEPTQVCLLLTPFFPLPQREYAEKGRYLTTATQAVSILREGTPIEGDTLARLTLRFHERGQGLVEENDPGIVERLHVYRKDRETGLGVELEFSAGELELTDMDNDRRLDSVTFPIRHFGTYVVALKLDRPRPKLHERQPPSPRYRPRDEAARPSPHAGSRE